VSKNNPESGTDTMLAEDGKATLGIDFNVETEESGKPVTPSALYT
jgi:hypothetical protein